MRADATIVCVLGTPRSGTSLSARLLDAAGVFFGEEDLLADPGQVPPDWEHRRITDLNHQISRALGGGVRPSQLQPGWERDDRLAATRESADEAIEELFGERDLWGWKDPQTTLLLPFWQRLLPQMRYVICLRNPADVIASGQEFASERGIEISKSEAHTHWIEYIAHALVRTSGHPRVIVPYERYFDDPEGTVKRLAGLIGVRAAPRKVRKMVAPLIQPKLWHHRAGAERDDPGVPVQTESLYLAARLLAEAAEPADTRRSAEMNAAVDLYARRLLEELRRRSGETSSASSMVPR